jgi:iron complex outermembrane receptor protein
MALVKGTPFAAAMLLLGIAAFPQAQTPPAKDLTQVSLEDLLNTKVTSVSKKEQTLSTAGAAIFVITQEDIRRSGATNIPDLLRMAPGVNVAQVNANTWAISIRGFNDIYADKVLVLIDGRSVYNPTFSGVNWDQQDVPLEDIERIEIIRGPGGTVWGGNAMNGVINIITKSSKSTPGGLISAGTGSQTAAQSLAQYGGTMGDNGTYRAFVHYFDQKSSIFPGGAPAADSYGMLHGGFRGDWQLAQRDTFTLQGDFQQSRIGDMTSGLFGPLLESSNQVTTGNILGRWNRTFSERSATSLQIYYDSDHRNLEPNDVDAHLGTIDLDFNHHLAVGSRHDFVWGLGYRSTGDRITPSNVITFTPSQQRTNLFSVFIQDQIKLSSEFSLTLGSKFEHNSYTGYETEPSAQLVWQVRPEHSLWLSASKAIRQPSRSDNGLEVGLASIPVGGGATGFLALFGNTDVEAEELRDYEAGYRALLNKHFSLDVVGFVSFYRRLRTEEPGSPYDYLVDGSTPVLLIPLNFENRAHARDYGGEVFATWTATSRWKMMAGYSQLRMDVTRDPSSLDTTVQQIPGFSPAHQFQIRSQWNPRPRWEWDASLAYTGPLTTTNVPGFARLDTRIGWHASESIELSLVGQNLLSPGHLEFIGTEGQLSTLVQRSVFGKVTWRF